MEERALAPNTVTPVVGRQLPERRDVGRTPGRRRTARSADPSSRPDTSRFHIIQPVVENQKKRSSGPEVVVEDQRLEVLDGDAAVAVHDRLRQAGRARRVQEVQRVVERHGLELERRTASSPSSSAHGSRRRRRRRVEVRQVDRRAAASAATTGSSPPRRPGRRPCRRSGSRRPRAARSARSAPKPVDHAAERRTRARTTTRSRRSTRWPGTPPPSRAGSAGRPPPGRPAARPSRRRPAAARADLRPQLAPRQVDRSAGLRPADHRDRVVAALAAAEGVVGVVELGALEPPRPGHVARRQHRRERRGVDLGVLPPARPRSPRGGRPTSGAAPA